MKLVRFEAAGRTVYGILNNGRIAELEGGLQSGPATPASVHALSRVKLLAPCRPSKIVAVGLNYRDHADELRMETPATPILFLKPPSAVVGPGAAIVYPGMSLELDFEAELGVVIRDRVRNVRPHEALGHVLGYTCVNDVTARDLQKKDGQWTRAKSFDTFCPVGPWIETDLEPDDLLIESYLNGEQRQSSRTAQFIFKVRELVSFISETMTLEPGDLIITGTPAGVGPMRPGDEIEVRIEGIGSLVNTVSAES